MRLKILANILLLTLLLSLLVAVFPSSEGAAGTAGIIVGHIERAGIRGDMPVDNATVTLSNGMSITTDSNGRFEFDNVSAGNYTLTVINNGRTALTKDVTVIAGQTLDLGTLTQGGGIFGLIFVILVPLIIVVVVVVIIVYLLLRRKRRKKNERSNRQQQEQQEADLGRE
jgi:uncharacterized membrane protein